MRKRTLWLKYEDKGTWPILWDVNLRSLVIIQRWRIFGDEVNDNEELLPKIR